ncbi:hypothetical protein DUI87_02529 [Hirundo rustica rustica]|uniref:Uncharacterized protein n=1 Tax=Hirundo rustica rustica TaxID=333673 RepID=A0A3M0L970_HIRRU|nr:hypothetical protein DUI87_02529 [Hirundo rustica rustica]
MGRGRGRRRSHNACAKFPPFSAVPEETPVDQERETNDPCCQPPSPDNVPLSDELEEDPSDGAEPPTEPTIGFKRTD